MESDNYLLNNFIPGLAAIFGATIACTIIFQKLKKRWRITANCWFCNTNAKIWREESDWWLCPSCKQYNGFSKNGDYAYDIPEQYNVISNGIKTMSSHSKKTLNKRFGNGLCEECNKYETIKISKLSAFEPTSDRKYDYEIKSFKDKLEAEYPLCTACKSKVQNVLCEQAFWLSRDKMLFFTQKSILKLIQNNNKFGPICHTILVAIASGTAYYVECWPLPVCGVLFQLLAHTLNPNKRKLSNIFIMALWLCLIALPTLKEIIFNVYSNYYWFKYPTLQHVTQYQFVILLTSVICLMNVRPWVYKSGTNNPVMFKKLSINRKRELLDESETLKKTVNNDEMQKVEAINTTDNNRFTMNLMSSPTTPIIKKLEPNEFLLSMKNSSNGLMNECLQTSWKSSPSENVSVSNISSNLSTLSLSESLFRPISRTPEIFEKRIYNTTSPELFTRKTNGTNKRLILAPPKLKSVTQASWVAGGYWQEGMDVPTLSRSSSQSSGFDSAGSNFNPSKEPSVYDFDRCSVTSDVNSVKSFDRHCVVSQCSSAKPQCSPRGQLCRLNASHTYSHPSHTFTSHNNCPNTGKSVFGSQCGHHHHGVNDLANLPEKQVVSNNIAPVTSNNQFWLTTLLCGSLVVNIIVLCITLLR